MHRKSQLTSVIVVIIITIVMSFLLLFYIKPGAIGYIDLREVVKEGFVGQPINFSFEYYPDSCSNVSTKITSLNNINDSFDLKELNRTDKNITYQLVAYFQDQYMFTGNYDCLIDNFSLPYTEKITFDIQLPREARTEEEKRMNFQQVVKELKKHNQIINDTQENISSIAQTLKERERQDEINFWIIKLKDICLIVLFFLTISPRVSKKFKDWINGFIKKRKFFYILIVIIIILVYFFSDKIVSLFIK